MSGSAAAGHVCSSLACCHVEGQRPPACRRARSARNESVRLWQGSDRPTEHPGGHHRRSTTYDCVTGATHALALAFLVRQCEQHPTACRRPRIDRAGGQRLSEPGSPQRSVARASTSPRRKPHPISSATMAWSRSQRSVREPLQWSSCRPCGGGAFARRDSSQPL